MRRIRFFVTAVLPAVAYLTCSGGLASKQPGPPDIGRDGEAASSIDGPPGGTADASGTAAADARAADALPEGVTLAGLAVEDVTPQWATHVIVHPFTVTSKHYQNIEVKALALGDGRFPIVLVTADVGVFCSEVSEQIYGRLKTEVNLDKHQIVLNASHTHSGPAICTLDDVVDPAQMDYKYQAFFVKGVIQAVEKALKDMRPAVLGTAESSCDICINRDGATDTKHDYAPNPNGPIDRRVRLLTVKDARDDKLRAVLTLFGCHTSDISDGTSFGGDFFGFGREEVAKQYPGLIVLTAQGTGGDVRLDDRDPKDPRYWISGTAEEYFARDKAFGVRFGQAIVQAIKRPPLPLAGAIRAELRTVMLPIEDADLMEVTLAAAGMDPVWKNDPWMVRWGTAMKTMYADPGIPFPRQVGPYAVRVMRMGDDFTIVALDGELFTCYGQQIEAALSPGRTLVFGYSNDIAAYVPCRDNLLKHPGGFEVNEYYWWLQPARFGLEVDKIIVDEAVAAARRLR